MPIRPENRDRYPANWPEISEEIKNRAGWRCECEGECGRGSHAGRCPNRHGQPAYGTGSRVVLTTAHLDHSRNTASPGVSARCTRAATCTTTRTTTPAPGPKPAGPPSKPPDNSRSRCRELAGQVHDRSHRDFLYLNYSHPDNSVCRVKKQGCVAVTGSSKHWPCLFPQHGPGKKHDRTIALEHWQQEIVQAHPWEFIRGLIHSDGCRITNWTTRLVAGERKRYAYPRYFFSKSPTTSGSSSPTPLTSSVSSGQLSLAAATRSTSRSPEKPQSP